MDLSQHNAGVVDALEELKGTAAPVLEEIGTETLLNDLRSIIMDEIGDKLAKLIVREFSGQEFTEENVLDILRSTIEEPHTTPKSPDTIPAPESTPSVTTDTVPGPPVPGPPAPGPPASGPTAPKSSNKPKKTKSSDKPKRKNRVSGYTLYKKDPVIKEKINVE